MSWLVVAPIIVPLLAAAVSTAAGGRPRVQRVVGIGAIVAHLAIAIMLLVRVDRLGTQVVDVGAWPAPAGIALVADRFSAILLTVAAVMFLAVLVYAVAQMKWEETTWYFHPVYLTLTAGVSVAFLTGDIFNLFVAFEVTLISSYVLLTLRAERREVRATMTYVIINLLASALFLSGVAFLYAATGTVNMADLAGRVGNLPDPVRIGLGTLFLVVFGIKAAIFPLFNWLPDAYPTAPTAVTAIFAGLLTKIGVYAIVRTQTLIFAPEGPSTLLLFIAGATMLIGVLGAVSQGEVKRILSFHIISQIGYMIMGLGFLTLAGLAATVLYMVHHIVVKTGLFLVGGLVEAEAGTGRLERLGGLLHRGPVAAVLFLPLALSLAGLPPFSGFVAKLALIREGLALDRPVVVAVSLLVSLLTLFSMTKIWAAAFWGESEDRPARPFDRTMVGATAALLVVSLVVAFAAQPLYELAARAAGDLVDPGAYVEAVMGRA
ncbi:MAG: proton-conducting transporter membrane subunit [Acidimicrobiia bacterium]